MSPSMRIDGTYFEFPESLSDDTYARIPDEILDVWPNLIEAASSGDEQAFLKLGVALVLDANPGMSWEVAQHTVMAAGQVTFVE